MEPFVFDERFPNARIRPYVHTQYPVCPHRPRPAVIVFPGGGYAYCYPGEGETIALSYMNAGMNAYVLNYSCCENAKFPTPLLEAGAAVAYVRARAAEDNTDPDRIFVIGFSAGGHLAGALATNWQREDLFAPLGIKDGANRPTGVILSYPVVTGGEKRERGSFCKLLGKEDPTEEELAIWSNEKNVTDKMPPAFIWHAAEDCVVPVENSLLMASAMAACGVSLELHVFRRGGHGISLATEETAYGKEDIKVVPGAAVWMPLSITWIKSF